MTGDVSGTVGTGRYSATIRRTTHGVAHVLADTVPDVVFGQAYACAADHLPLIADQVLKTRSERARFLGAGPDDAHLQSDLGYLALGITPWAERMAAEADAEVRAVVDAYAAGLNRWLAEHGTSSLPAWCRDAPWVRPVSAIDLFRMYADAALMASGRNLARAIGSAQPPGTAAATAAPVDPPFGDDTPGSNGWALGRAVMAGGRGAVVANPHFPWYGDGRFWECHLTVPDELDVYGVSLIGTPGVQIGFNRHVAWTHTFSRGHRFVIYQLDLLPGHPTAYRYGEEERGLEPTVHRIEVLGDDGALATAERTLWRSHQGPIVDIPLLGWSESAAFALADVNDGNDRFLAQYLAMDRAHSTASLRDAVRTHQGLPWVNVLAADDAGEVWYADPSPVPHLSPEAEAAYVERVDTDLLTQLFLSQRVALLPGSDPTFALVETDPAEAPGHIGHPAVVPMERLPEFHTDTVAFNANDAYWVPHPDETLPPGPVLAGLHTRPLSPRSRMNCAVLADEAPSGPSPTGWTLDDLERALLDNRSLLAEQLVDGVVARLRAAGLDAPAAVLAAWSRTFDVDARGAALWREFLAGFGEDELRCGGRLFAEPFDPARPTRTPCGLAAAPADGPDPVVTAMEAALAALAAAGVAPDARLGDVQYVDRSGERIPLHGGAEVEGIVNVVTPMAVLGRTDLEPAVPRSAPVPGRERTGLHEGGYPCTYGASSILVVGFDEHGPVGRGLLAYGQSGDPHSPHHVDQMREFSAKRLRPLRFHEADVLADPHLTVERVEG